MEPAEHIGYDLILKEIPDYARVLDLGCGDGDLLALLVSEKKIEAHGVEISQSGVAECVKKGLFVSHGDIDEGLSNYKDNSFDYVIINQTLPNTKNPEFVMKEIMRIGKRSIVSFPNFVYFPIRVQMLFTGTLPTTRALPFAWYDSPNFHFISLNDFKNYCRLRNYPIKKELHYKMKTVGTSRIVRLMPNLFAEYGLFVLDGIKFSEEIADT
jgi:methionine biosynthesis protein MetW